VGSPFALRPRLSDITLNVILRIVFGSTEDNPLVPQELLKRFLALGANSLLMVPWLQIDLGSFTPWGRFLGLRRELHRIFLAEVAKRRAIPDGARDDMLSMLVEARDESGQSLSDSELRDELLTLIVAGNDTTASSLAWALYEILQHQEIVEQVRTELRSPVGRTSSLYSQQLDLRISMPPLEKRSAFIRSSPLS
jgi:cytochrome P450